MSALIGTATDYQDLLAQVKSWLCDKGSAFGLAYSGVGDGTFTAYRGGASSVAETFTITATSASSFDVVGSVSGSIGPATVGTPFADAKIEFTIEAGDTDFEAGDEFTINTAPKWTAMRYTAGSELILKAPGNDGTQEIYVGIQTFSNATGDYYNWRLGGFTGFNNSFTFANQPNAMTRPVVPLTNGSIAFWLVNNGRSVRMVAKVSTVYEPMYLGHIDPYMTPGEFPYPLLVAGAMTFNSEPASTSTNWRWSYTGTEHRAFPMGIGNNGLNWCAARFRMPDGTWRGFGAVNDNSGGHDISNNGNGIWPYAVSMDNTGPNLDGSYPLFPIVLYSSDAGNTWGALDGVYAVPGFGMTAETELTIGRDRYMVFPDIFRAGLRSFYAMKLD